jgi:hypothetical protein
MSGVEQLTPMASRHGRAAVLRGGALRLASLLDRVRVGGCAASRSP